MRIFIFSIVICVSLLARVNPFEPTDTFEEKRAQLIKQQDQRKPLVTVNFDEKTEQNITKEEEVTPIVPVKTVTALPKKKVVKKIKSNCKESYIYTPLKFVKIHISIDSFKVEVDKKYKLIAQDIKDDEKKFIFDFEYNDGAFYTKRQKLCHEYFDSFAIGSHPKENFFRVVIKVKEDIVNYKENSNLENGTVNYK